MSLWQAIVLAVVQGLTEFLPISSTAHLILVPWLLGWHDPGLAYDVALHAGTLVAVLAYFARDWWEMIRDSIHCFFRAQYGPLEQSSLNTAHPPGRFRFSLATRLLAPVPHSAVVNSTLLQIVVVATIPAALAGYFLESYAASVFRSPGLIAAALMAVALLLWLADRRKTLARGVDKVGFADAVVIGLAQAVAIVPGTSRAGITIAAGLFRNLTRESAARFSFLLATPIIGGATLLEGAQMLEQGLPPGTSVRDFVVGFVVSALVGYGAIAFLLRYLQVRTLKIFVAYRLALGAIILAIEFLRSSG